MNPTELQTALKYGAKLHKSVADALRSRLRMSEQKMKDRYSDMAKNEELFQAYIPEKDVDADRRVNKEQRGINDYRTIEMPYSYAVAMTAHTYYTSVFLARTPVLQLTGRHGESEQKTQAFEALLAYQLTVGKNIMPMFTWLLDPAKYGFGVVGHFWDKKTVRARKAVDQPVTFMGVPIPGVAPKKVWTVEDTPGYQGASIYNVRPQDFFPDPRVALAHFQKGEFCSRYTEVSWSEIYNGQKTGRYFNYEILKKMRKDQDNQAGGQLTRDEGSSRVTTLPNDDKLAMDIGYDVPVGSIRGHEVYVRLSPSDWGLDNTSSDYEIWVFNISTNGVIFGAMPLGEYHGDFPFDIILDEIDGYSLFPKSMLERSKPLNDVMTWLINTHFYNVRASLNNQFVVDPSMVVMKDLENPDPGKIIRLKPTAYGKDVRTILAQLQVQDVTRGNLADIGLMGELIQRMTGVNDSIMGMVESGGRKTATEVRTSTSFGVNRLKTQCEWMSTCGFGPLTQKLVQMTQQHYSLEQKYRLVGDLAAASPTFAMVTPDMISGSYDFEPVDGSLPIDRHAQATLWQQLMQTVQQDPRIMGTYDTAKIFSWVATLAGVKNTAQFKLVPDGQMMQQVQAGNSVPLSAPNTQMPGMGPTA